MNSTKKLIPVLSVSMIGLIALVGVVMSQSKGKASTCYAGMTLPTPEQSLNPNDSITDDSYRANCPGKILCPVTGKIICKDRCPLNKEVKNTTSKSKSNLSSCCTTKKG